MTEKPTPIRLALRCLRLLREGWHDKATLADRLGVSERTVKRYLAAIADEEQDLAIRTADDFGLRQYAVRPARWREQPGRIRRVETLALVIAERFFRAFDPGGVAELIDQALFELTGREADEDPEQLRKRLARRFVLARTPQPLPGRAAEVFDRVLEAILHRRVVELDYRPRVGGTRAYVFRPYTLLLGEQELAVTGPLGEPAPDGGPRVGEAVRTFALNRIESITLRKQFFFMPGQRQWDPDELFASSWGLYTGPASKVRVAVHPAFAGLVAERRWHPSQRVFEPGPDGWIPLEFDVFTGGELRTWLLGWGPWLRVEGPEDLAQWIEETRQQPVGSGEPSPEDLFRIV